MKEELYRRLYETVAELRKVQRAFFKGDRDQLPKAKLLEREVDILIQEITDGQGRLFK